MKNPRKIVKVIPPIIFFLLGASGVLWAQIAVFPFEDLTKGATGINMEVSEYAADVLRHRGFQVIPPQRVVSFLAKNRLRWTGWSDRLTAKKVENELKGQFILLGTITQIDPEQHAFGMCARILSASDYRLIWGQTIAMSELNQISLLGLGRKPWDAIKRSALDSMLQNLPLDISKKVASPPMIEVLQIVLRPRYARSEEDITCGVKFSEAGAPPNSLAFLIEKDKIFPAIKSGAYYTATWKAPPVEGRYSISLMAKWSAPWMMEKRIFLASFYVDNHPPKFQLRISHGEHLPAGIAFRRHVRIVPVITIGEPILRWRLEIISLKEKGIVLREDQQGKPPPAFLWRGTDRTGHPLPNGSYLVRLTLWDLAGNMASAEDRLLLVKQLPEVTVEALALGKGLEVEVAVGKHPIPLTSWRLEIWDRDGDLVVKREGEGAPPTIQIPNKKGLRYTLELRDDFGNRLLLRNKKLKVVKADTYGGKTKKSKRWINEF